MQLINTEIKDNYLIATVETNPNIFDQHYSRYFALSHKHIKVKGFRKGKVPFDLAKQHVNYEYINQNTFDAVVKASIEELIKTKEFIDFESFDTPSKNELVEFKQEEKKLVFKSYFETKPDVELGNFDKIESIFEPKDLKDVYWMEPLETVEKDAIIYLKLFAVDAEQKTVHKYCIESFEIDLKNTKIKPEILDGIKKGAKGTDHEFKVTIDGKEISFYSRILAMFKRATFTEEAVKKINDPKITTVDELKAAQKKLFEQYNSDSHKNIVIKWASSDANVLSYIPTFNISVEAKKTLNQYLKTHGAALSKNQDLQNKVYENICYDNLLKIKVSCVIDKVANSLGVKVTKQQITEATEKFQNTPEIASTLNQKDCDANQLFESIAKQEQCIEELKKKIIFSN